MAKIVLDSITKIQDISILNENFDKIEQEFQNKVLYRNNPVGEVNTLETDVDVNGKRLYNLAEPTSPNEAARLQDIQEAIAGNIGFGAFSANVDAPIVGYITILDENNISRKIAVIT